MGSTNATSKRRKSSRQSRLSLKSNKGENGTGNFHDLSPPGSDVVKKEEAASFSTSPEEDHGWNHPAELDYFMPHSWSDTQIIHHLIAHSFNIPAKTGQPFCHIISANGVKTVLPGGYRIPLMFLARFQWLSLQLVLMAEDREAEWEDYKFGILHVSRLCKRLLDSAQAALETRFKYGVDRKWRCPTFDRALVRHKLKWFISKPEEVQSFWEEYGEGEFKDDIVTFAWRGWALKGHCGFSLTLNEIENGITAQQLMQGLKERDDRWYWEVEGSPAEGADAWSLRHAALAAMSTTVLSLPPKIIPGTPLTTSKLLHTPPISTSTRPSNIPTDQVSNSSPNNAELQQAPSLPRSNSSVEAVEPGSNRPYTYTIRIPQSAGVEVPTDNEDANLVAMEHNTTTTSGPPSSVRNIQTQRASKRPGSPLEKVTSPKPRKTANDHLPDPEATPYSPMYLVVPTSCEPGVPTPSHLGHLTSPIQLRITDADSSQTTIPTRQLKAVALPPLTRSLLSTAASTPGPIHPILWSTSTASNACPQTSSHIHSSPSPIQATHEYLRTLEQQWQQLQSKLGSEGVTFSSLPSPSTSASMSSQSISRPASTNADNNARPIDFSVMFTPVMEGVFEEMKKVASESQERHRELISSLAQIRAELEALRNGEGVGGVRSVVGTATSNDVNMGSAVAPLVLSSHPLAHLLEEPTSDEEDDGFNYGLVPEGLEPGVRARNYSGAPMLMNPDIIILDREILERKPVVEGDMPSSAPRPASPILDDEIIDVKPVIINGEPCIPGLDGGQPTPLTAFSCSVPVRYRKFKKLGISSSGESISSASSCREKRSAA
ncbi:hypothetical protein AAF712_010975 [Marasmius tenuissimus]|uniref:Uncharacterized protein n=1 Tax=Marasmius tenuissimus TaxID=585030 RepID=A0ABR2ZN34_9AGAR